MPNPEHLGADFIAGFMDDYFAECDEHLTEVRRILLAADPSAGGVLTKTRIEDLFRSFHSLKGLSGMVELRDAELLAHEMESYLRLLRDGEATLSAEGHQGLVKGTQILEQVIAARRERVASPLVDDTLGVLRALSAPAPLDPAQATETPAVDGRRWRATFSPSAELAARGINVDHVRRTLRESAQIVEAAPRIGADGSISFEFVLDGLRDSAAADEWVAQGISIVAIEAAVPEAVAAESEADPSTSAGGLLTSSHFVRVDLARLDDLMRMIGDLVISRARLGESLSHVEQHLPPTVFRAVHENSLAIERQLRDLREGVMRLRLVPVGEIFRRMSFVVRDLARESGKKIELRFRGQDTEIDKYLVERMMDPVLHLVRNAVTHGIEAPHLRVAQGKPETGSLALLASSVGDLVTIEIADDGAGVDVEAVARRAALAGMPVPAGTLEGAALLEILCAPGFSTREATDRAAGRGVGMDVVQSTIRELGGTLSIDTAPGEGTRFIIQLPVSLAIADAIVASVGGQTFAIPQSAIREVVEIDPATLKAIENHEVAPYRGGVLPIVRLSKVFGITPQPGRALYVFVVGQGVAVIGVAVDRILGQREVVVRPMVDPLVRVDGITGATDLGDGRVVLMLDLTRLGHQ